MKDSEKFYQQTKELEEIRIRIAQMREDFGKKLKAEETLLEGKMKAYLTRWFKFKENEQFGLTTIAQRTFEMTDVVQHD